MPAKPGDGARERARSGNGEIITEQQAQWLEARAAGHTPVEAARIAGYNDPYNAAFRLTRNQTLLMLNQVVGAIHGVDLSAIFETISRNLRAKKLITAKFKGEITDQMEVDDGDLQLRAAALAADLLGVKPAEEHKFVRDEDETGATVGVPEHFRNVPVPDLLAWMQRAREAQMLGTAAPILPQSEPALPLAEPLPEPRIVRPA